MPTFARFPRYRGRAPQAKITYTLDPYNVYVAPSSQLLGESQCGIPGSDANVGTAGNPLASIDAAFIKCAPGGTIWMYGGVYAPDAGYATPFGTGGTALARKALKALPGHDVRIDPRGIPMPTGSRGETGGQHVLSITVPYVDIEGITIDATSPGGGGRAGFFISGSHVTVTRCQAKDTFAAGFLIYSGTEPVYGVSDGGVTDVDIISCYATSCSRRRLVNTSYANWDPAFSSLRASRVNYIDCISEKNYGEGIGTRLVVGGRTEGCISCDNYSVNIYHDNVAGRTTKRNLVYSTLYAPTLRAGAAPGGLQFACEDTIASGEGPPIYLQDLIVEDNLVLMGNHLFYYSNYGNGGGLRNCIVRNNTLYTSTGTIVNINAAQGTGVNAEAGVAHVGNEFHHNIFVQQSGKSKTAGSAAVGFDFHDNDWFGGNGSSFAGTGDIAVDPLFVGPTSGYARRFFLLGAGSPAVGMGITTGDVSAGPDGVATVN